MLARCPFLRNLVYRLLVLRRRDHNLTVLLPSGDRLFTSSIFTVSSFQPYCSLKICSESPLSSLSSSEFLAESQPLSLLRRLPFSLLRPFSSRPPGSALTGCCLLSLYLTVLTVQLLLASQALFDFEPFVVKFPEFTEVLL
jgi:hypothetical protein